MNRPELLHKRYGKRIWLTEFAVCCTRDDAAVIEFVQARYSLVVAENILRFITEDHTETGGSRICV